MADEQVAERLQEILAELYEMVGFEPPSGYDLAGVTLVAHNDPVDESQTPLTMPIFLFPEPPSLQRIYDASGALAEMARMVSEQNSLPEKREMKSATIGGRIVPADRLICPDCNSLDLNATFDSTDPIEWKGTCGRGHTWKFNVVDCPRDEEP